MALTVGGSPLAAQARLGVFGAFSSARVDATEPDPTGIVPRNPRHGFTGGAAASFNVIGNVGLTIDLLPVEKGFTQGTAYALDIHYLDIPVLVNARYPLTHHLTVQVGGGVTWSVRESCSEFRNGAYLDDCVDTDVGEVVPKHDLGVTGGFAVIWRRFWLGGQVEATGKNLPARSPGLGLQNRSVLVMLGVDLVRLGSKSVR